MSDVRTLAVPQRPVDLRPRTPLVDLLTARALAHGLRGIDDDERAAEAIAVAASGNGTAVRMALRRIERGNASRPGAVGLRAERVLRLVALRVA